MSEALLNEIQELKHEVEKLSHALDSTRGEVTHLKLIIEKYRHMLFGSKSEKRELGPDVLSLFDLISKPQDPAEKPAEEQVEEKPEDKTVEIAAHTRKVKNKFTDDEESPEGTFPEHLPRREQVIDEKPEGVAEEDLELVTEKVTERLGVTPEEYYVTRIVRHVYKQKSTGKFHTPELPDHVLARRCKVSEACIVLFIIKKFLWHLPLYRQQQQLRLQGLDISRDSLTKWVLELGALFNPIAVAIAEAIRGAPVVHIDETPMKVGKANARGNKEYKTGYFWPILAPGVGVSFVYRPTRCWGEVQTVLKKFAGVLVSDAYEAYDSYVQSTKAKWQLCWMHIRRNFIECERSNPALAKEALRYIQELYRIEGTLRAESDEKRGLERVKQSKPVLDSFHAWLVKISAQPEVLTDNNLSKAVSYVLSRWEAATLFVNDGAIPIDNGKAERAIRPGKLGLKNWLHCTSEEGAEAAAIFYTLIGSALMHGIHPYYYLVDLCQRISDPSLKAVDLIPANWKNRFYEQAVPQHLRDVILDGEPAVGGPKPVQAANL
jgi:transposase